MLSYESYKATIISALISNTSLMTYFSSANQIHTGYNYNEESTLPRIALIYGGGKPYNYDLSQITISLDIYIYVSKDSTNGAWKTLYQIANWVSLILSQEELKHRSGSRILNIINTSCLMDLEPDLEASYVSGKLSYELQVT